MKKILFYILLSGWPFAGPAQQTVFGTIMHNGLQRTYILYIPSSYTGLTPVPLVMNFHGYTSTSAAQMVYGDFRPIADTAGFLVVHPMGTQDVLGNNHWNVGWGGSTVDDVGFTAALIDSLEVAYNINSDRVYCTGMSNGGFFCYLLACALSGRFAAMASVAGTMNAGQPANCNATHPMPVMEIHGTADSVVVYNGNITILSVPATVAYWVGFNQCDSVPVVTPVPDLDPGDGSTVEHRDFANGAGGVHTEHFKVIGGGHSWPGNPFGGNGTNNDIDASVEIWRFFSRYDLNGLINPTAIVNNTDEGGFSFFPNPAGSFITLHVDANQAVEYTVHHFSGAAVLNGTLYPGTQTLDIRNLSPGLYLMHAGDRFFRFIKTD